MKGNTPNIGLIELLMMAAVLGKPKSEEYKRMEALDFTGIDDEDKKLWAETVNELRAIDPNEIEAAFITVVHRKRQDVPCQDCGTVHSRPSGKDGVFQTATLIGRSDVISDAVYVVMEKVAGSDLPDFQVIDLMDGDQPR